MCLYVIKLCIMLKANITITLCAQQNIIWCVFSFH